MPDEPVPALGVRARHPRSGTDILEQAATDPAAPHDFCGYPRGDMADLGAIEYSTEYQGTPCAEIVKEMYDRIP